MSRVGRPLSAIDPGAGGFQTLGYELQRRRLRAGFNQETLAALAGCSRQPLGALERGSERPSSTLIQALDHALDANGALIRRFRVARAEDQEELRDVDRRDFLRTGAGIGAGLGLAAFGVLGPPAAGSDLAATFQHV